MAAQTVNHSRMSRAEALRALALVKTQIVTHGGMCGACREAREAKKRRVQSWSLWTTCEGYRGLLRTRLSIEHRLHYLKQSAVKKAAAVYGLNAYAFQREHASEYAEIARLYGDQE